jgi:peptidoglycan/LPS O-acetylase OafA/YrhL
MSLTNPHLAYRADIDGLRAIAILSVLIFHAFPSWLPGGFIGVDIFFVISGYLISSIIFNSLHGGKFSFSDFYARRIRRIFPPLLLVILVFLVAGWHVLLPDEYAQLAKHSLAGLGFMANFVFWLESGYFDNAAELKPLLHLWSLGIEEQFYIVWPALAVFAWKRGWTIGRFMLLLAVFSLLASIFLTRPDPVASFFLPLTRAWELLAGACLAWLVFNHRLNWCVTNPAAGNLLSVFGFGLLLAGFGLINTKSMFPGAWALLPVMGAMLLIAAGPGTLINRYFLARPLMVWIGLISFPLYLWHWPLLSFARIVYPEQSQSSIVIGAILALTFLFAWFSYRFIEMPIRRHGGRKAVILLLLFASVLAVAAANIFNRDGLLFRFKGGQLQNEAVALEWPNELKSTQDCSAVFKKHGLTGLCLVADVERPANAMIIGDSHANYYFWALRDVLLQQNLNLLQIASAACMGVRGSDLFEDGKFLGCPQHIDTAMEYALENPVVHTVFIAGRWAAYISGREFRDWHTGNRDEHQVVWFDREGKQSPYIGAAAIEHGLDETLSALEAKGKKVVFLYSVPELDFNARLCLTWAPNQFVRRSAPYPDCAVDLDMIEKRNLEFRHVIDDVLKRHPQVGVLDPQTLMCDDEHCYGRQDDLLLYRDDDHLSLDGSKWLGRKLQPQLDRMLIGKP